MSEEVKVTVDEFIQSYSSAQTKQAKDKVCKNIVVRKYVPILEKYSVLLLGFNRAVRDANGMINYNGVMQYVMYIMLTLKMYTNLDLDGENKSTFDAYDQLRECGAIDQILLAIGEDELKEIERINQFILSDVKENELNPYHYIAAQISRLRDTGKEFIEMFLGEEVGQNFRNSVIEQMNKIQQSQTESNSQEE